MPTTNSGTQSDTNFPAVQTNQIDVDDEIAMLEGSAGLFAPQYARSMKKAAKSQNVEWLEDEAQPIYTTIGTDALATGVDTTVDVAAGTGQHIKINDVLHVESTGEYGAEGYVFQELAPIPELDGKRPVIGSWIIGQEAAGMGVRESEGWVTGNTSRFVPHLFK